jgi:acetoin utilization protein AcuC
VLAALTWHRKARPAPEMLSTLADAPRPGPVSPDLHADLGRLMARLKAWV